MMRVQTETRIRAIGRIEGYRNDIRTAGAMLDALSLWQPAVGLGRQAGEVLRLIDDLEARFDRKLVVTLIGPSGAGKSTLLNALAGVDDLSPAGHDRPTTREVVALCREASDARFLTDLVGGDPLRVEWRPGADRLENVILIDTPDTDSVALENHVAILHAVIGLSDLLICVFDGENPKRKDHIDFMAPHIQKFSGESIIGVINKCDRLSEAELKESVVPDFIAHIRKAWQWPAEAVFCVSSRQHLKDPAWDPDAAPRHRFDQFDALRGLIFGAFDRPGFAVDRRLGNAARLRDYLMEEIGREVERDRSALTAAAKAMGRAEKAALADAMAALEAEIGQTSGIDPLLYALLAQRWLGPVGWLIALWSRLLTVGAGIAGLFRSGNPFHRITGLADAVTGTSRKRGSNPPLRSGSDAVSGAFRRAVLKVWPDIAEGLAAARFDLSVETALGEIDDPGPVISRLWEEILAAELERYSRRLSIWPLQLLLNVPILGAMAHAGWITAREYIAGSYLPAGFFLHAAVVIGTLFFLSFFLFQGGVRLIAGRDRILRKVFKRVNRRLEGHRALSDSPIGRQIETFYLLGDRATPKKT